MVSETTKKSLANLITLCRIIQSFFLIFLSQRSVCFFIAYLICGASDAADGIVARKTNTTSTFGAKLDTIADLLFTAVVFAKLLPIIRLPTWLLIWSGFIAAVKFANAVLWFVKEKSIVSVHSVMNKITGALLFVFPLTFNIAEPKYGAVVVCAVATLASIHETHYITCWKEVNPRAENN